MHAERIETPAFAAPRRLITSTRDPFRADAVVFLENAKHGGATQVWLDLRDTVDIDSSGLGMLVMLHRQARDLGLTPFLANVSPEIRAHLESTRLDTLFQYTE